MATGIQHQYAFHLQHSIKHGHTSSLSFLPSWWPHIYLSLSTWTSHGATHSFHRCMSKLCLAFPLMSMLTFCLGDGYFFMELRDEFGLRILWWNVLGCLGCWTMVGWVLSRLINALGLLYVVKLFWFDVCWNVNGLWLWVFVMLWRNFCLMFGMLMVVA